MLLATESGLLSRNSRNVRGAPAKVNLPVGVHVGLAHLHQIRRQRRVWPTRRTAMAKASASSAVSNDHTKQPIGRPRKAAPNVQQGGSTLLSSRVLIAEAPMAAAAA